MALSPWLLAYNPRTCPQAFKLVVYVFILGPGSMLYAIGGKRRSTDTLIVCIQVVM